MFQVRALKGGALASRKTFAVAIGVAVIVGCCWTSTATAKDNRGMPPRCVGKAADYRYQTTDENNKPTGRWATCGQWYDNNGKQLKKARPASDMRPATSDRRVRPVAAVRQLPATPVRQPQRAAATPPPAAVPTGPRVLGTASVGPQFESVQAAVTPSKPPRRVRSDEIPVPGFESEKPKVTEGDSCARTGLPATDTKTGGKLMCSNRGTFIGNN